MDQYILLVIHTDHTNRIEAVGPLAKQKAEDLFDTCCLNLKDADMICYKVVPLTAKENFKC